MKKLTVIFYLLTIVSLCGSVYAERNNMLINGEFRGRWFTQDDKDLNDDMDDNFSFFEIRTQVDVIGEMTDGVTAVVTGEATGFLGDKDATISTDAGSGDADLPQAYVQFSGVKNSFLSATFGRKFLNYGDGFLISDAEREVSYDGVEIVGDLAPVTVSLAGLQLKETFELGDDVRGWLVDIDYSEAGVPVALGGYVIAIDDSSDTDMSPTTIGVRGQVNPLDILNIQGEFAYQTGDTGGLDKEAYGLDVRATVDLDLAMAPQFTLAYYMGSGDDDPADGDDNAFDPLGQYRYYGHALSPALSNIRIINASVAINPSEFWQLSLDYYHYTQDEKAVASVGNSLLTDPGISVPTNGTDDDIGSEVDLSVTHIYTGDVRAMVTLAYFSPGDAYDTDEAIEVRGELLVSF
jgi:Alginate export